MIFRTNPARRSGWPSTTGRAPAPRRSNFGWSHETALSSGPPIAYTLCVQPTSSRPGPPDAAAAANFLGRGPRFADMTVVLLRRRE